MAQEIQLVDTIFYFVDTMEEYRLMLLENKVLSRVIVFVDETQEIYKDGKLFGGYQKAVEKINQLAEEVRQAMDLSENEVNELMRNLRDTIWNSFEDEVELINRNVEEYKRRLDELRQEFDQGYIEQGGVIQNIDELRGIIEEYAYWKTSVEGTLTTFGNIVNAQNATLRTFGERLDTINYSVTNYEHLVDLKEQSLKEYIENYDITSKVRSIIGREMLLQDGLLHDFATVTNVNDMVRSSVDVWFNSLQPSWTQLTSWAQKGNEAYNNITVMGGIDSRITRLDDTIAGIQSSVTIFSDWYNENREFLAYLKTSANGNEAMFDLQAQFNENNGDNDLVKVAAARIFGYVNSEGSTLALSADHLFMTGTDFKLNVDYIEGLGTWALGTAIVGKLLAQYGDYNIKINADPNDVYGIKASTNGFWFKLDGSGQVANGNITWDANGNVLIKGRPIDGGGNVVVLNDVYISNYWSKTEFNPSNYVTTGYLSDNLGDITGLTGGLKAWVLQKIQDAGTQEGLEINVQQIVQTTLNNEIARADGPFRNFVTNDGLNTKLTTDGYIRREGLLTEVTGVIYDGSGNLIATGPLYKALSELETMSAAIIAYDGNGHPYVTGAYAEQSISSQVEDYITHDAALSKLKTWALTIDGNSSTGFVLDSLVRKMKGSSAANNDNEIRAYIEGVVSDGESNITISADKITFNGVGEWHDKILIKDNNNNTTASIDKNGRISFNNGGVYIPTITVSQDSGLYNYNSNGIVITDSSMRSYLQGNSINFQSLGGTIYSGIVSSSTGFTFRSFINGHFDQGVVLALGGPDGYASITSTLNTGHFDISGFGYIRLFEDMTSDSNITLTGSDSSITLTGRNATISILGADAKITTTNLWVKDSALIDQDLEVGGESVFDHRADFYDDTYFRYNVGFADSGTIAIGNSKVITVGGTTTFTGTTTISGKTITIKKGLITDVS